MTSRVSQHYSSALVTGASSGIGEELARQLAARGSSLVLVARRADRLVALAEELSGVSVDVVVADLTTEAGVALVEQRLKDSPVELLVNNAGVALYGRFTELSLADFEWIMGINFWGAVYGSKLFLPMLLEEPEANIVTVSSVFGIVAPPLNSGYCASKFAVRGFSETLRHELALSNVRLTVVHPGGINTNIARTTRVGEKADAAKYAADSEEFQKKLKITPQFAAAAIVKAVLRDQPRLLIGQDAKLLDLIQRFWPARYITVLGPILDPQKKFRE